MSLAFRATVLTALVILGCGLLLSACGLGGGPGSSDADVVVTQNFGSQEIGSYHQPKVPGSETAMGLLQRHFDVNTRYGGGYVESINGHSGSSSHRDWFYFVNGILAPKGASATAVNAGARIWWDLHDWSATNTVSAVVGSFPAPFTRSANGRKLPTVLECDTNAQTACDLVAKALNAVGVKVAEQDLGGEAGEDSLTIVVGTWKDLNGVIASELIASGPSNSGVYGQFVGKNGAAIELDDPKGQATQTVRGSAGMVAATNQPSLNAAAWLVTGTDVAGVNAAARALTPAALDRHFAIVVAGSHVIPIPVQPDR